MKSERLKKLEKEYQELDRWLKLQLVPKKDVEKHKEEIAVVLEKIEEEKQRLHFIKENGEIEDYTLPKRGQNKAAYEMQSIPDIGANENTQQESDMETTTFEADHTTLFNIEMGNEEGVTTEYASTEEDPYSDKNRWKRSMEIADPDGEDEW